jgi:hypothetical protein
MKISFHGADQDVTGSCHLLECAGKRILIDCGMYQGGPSFAWLRIPRCWTGWPSQNCKRSITAWGSWLTVLFAVSAIIMKIYLVVQSCCRRTVTRMSCLHRGSMHKVI